jgi:hypothetical protein
MDLKEKLLLKCQQLYPKGTIFKSAYNPQSYPKCVSTGKFNFNGDTYNLFTNDNCVYYHSINIIGQGEQFAEIIEQVKIHELWI